MFFSISLTSLPLERAKHRAQFKLIQNKPNCKRGKGPIFQMKVLYFPDVFCWRTDKNLKEILWGIVGQDLQHAFNRGFCYNKESRGRRSAALGLSAYLSELRPRQVRRDAKLTTRRKG
jgi:hypothetical protein